MKIGVTWNATAIREPFGFRVVVNPRCRIVLMDGQPCGLPATTRVTNGTNWSFFNCFLHAQSQRLGPSQADWDMYWRLFPDAIERPFVNWLAERGLA